MCETIATTDSNGYFEFTQECLSLGITFEGIDVFGQSTGEFTLDGLMLFADDGQNYGVTDFLDLDENGTEVNIYLNNE